MSIKSKTKSLLRKFLTFKPFYNLLWRLFYIANSVMYKKSLIKCPILKFSIKKNCLRAPLYLSIYTFFQKLSQSENLSNKIAIEIGGSERSIKTILEEFRIDYKIAPNFPEVDICNLPYKDNSYDFIIIDQVLEHVEKPWIAAEEIFRVLKPGGICVTTGPFMIGYHSTEGWKDYFRYTPDGWKSLFSKFQILETKGWGNKKVVQDYLAFSPVGILSPPGIPVEKAARKGYLEYNDNKNYLFTWCIARKPFLFKK